jgi:hypothetical protein
MDRQDRETRRAENQVWNGWGDYARKPELLTFDRAGDAELYGNTVLGLACRYYDFDRFRPLLNEFHRSAQEALYTDVFFLVLEGAVFARGAAERPPAETERRTRREVRHQSTCAGIRYPRAHPDRICDRGVARAFPRDRRPD